MTAFRTTLDRCLLQDFPFEGDEFTWAKNRKNPTALKERLDWCLINKKWTDVFSMPKLIHLDYFGSDHRALLVNPFPSATTDPIQPRRSRFRFEKMWLSDAECAEIISTTWQMQSDCDLSSNLHINTKKCCEEPSSDAQLEKSILDDLLAKEEQYWQQRSRIEWLKSGDRNTKFFHTKASARNSTNKIKSLKDTNGNLVTDREGITNIISHYFQDLFTASEEDHWALSHVLSTIPTTIHEDQNDFLLRDFTKEDVYSALKSMASDKSPGLDGMSAMFYHHHWHIVGNLVSSVVLHILNENGDPTTFNKTLLTLIPKVTAETTMKDFRPISLCNVIYKLVSKMIVFRFKDVLPLVISETQSAFLPNRLITDNVLVAFEMIHSLKHRKHGTKGYAAIKLDMSKAFDRVEWSFLAAVMGKMGFNIRWISLIMRCLHTTSFSFNLNGSVVGSLIPQRGLRQGDPLSPYLFLICSEGLSRLLQYEEKVGRLKGYAVSRRAPTISHLFFADDSLLFCQADDRSCGSIKRALDIYHRRFGQELNLDKSDVLFSKYSFTSYSERDKKQLFADIKERIWKLMNSWNDKLFSIGGKEVLLKAVVQSIPTYVMSCFKLPSTFSHQLEQMMANFWWGSDKDKKKTHWRKWKLLCKTKMDGGMGFRSFIHFNQALLAKQAWRIIQFPHSLLSRVLKGRYFSHNDFLQASKTGCSSLTWQGICWGRDLLVKGLRLKIGDGSSVQCSSDPWIPRHSEFTPICFLGDTQNLVSYYITDDNEWNLPLLARDFSAVDVDYILSIPLSSSSVSDQWIWHFTNSNEYTVQSGYHLANDLEDSDLSNSSNNQRYLVEILWNPATPIQACSLCSNAWESVEHALFLCKHAKKVWRVAGISLNFDLVSRMSFADFLMLLSTLKSTSEMEQLLCTLWFLWNDRNNFIHGKPGLSPTQLWAKSVAYFCNFQQQSTSSKSIRDSTGAAAQPHWISPPLDKLKMNVDAACDISRNKIGVGIIIRNSSGQVVAAYSKPLTGRLKPQEMEAKALLIGINWAARCNLSINLFESDSLILVNSINSISNAISSFGDLVLDIKNRLSYLSSVCVSHVKRDANQAAHGLAKHALELDDDCMWFEEIPSTIFSVVVNDAL
uniref:Reverse transcriptase domain-containing protein n=1 Tax=Cannabis sativa TaxID=3483 RepID=A0A803NGI9_CANSA